MANLKRPKISFIEEKNNLVNNQSFNNQKYKGPSIQRPISSEREKLEIIAKSLNLDIENKTDDELRNMISSHLK